MSETPKRGRGRPKLDKPRITVSLRLPADAVALLDELVEEERAKHPGSKVNRPELYNRALAEFLLRHGKLLPGYNTPKAA